MNIGKGFGIQMQFGGDKAFFDSEIKPNLVILSHVVEHFNDLDIFFNKLCTHLEKNSYVYIEVPGILNNIRKRNERLSEDGYNSGNDFLGYLQFVHNYF